MLDVYPNLRLEVDVTLKLNESAARALDALVGYGTVPFLEAFYKVMGQAYLKPHEQGLRDLFAEIQNKVPGALAQAEEVRKTLEQFRRNGKRI